MLTCDTDEQLVGILLMRDDEIELTEREMAVAKAAARLAVKEITDDFYKGVGRTVVNRLLIVLGAAVVGVAYGKGWIQLPSK